MTPSLVDRLAVASALLASIAVSTLTVSVPHTQAAAGTAAYTDDALGRLISVTYDSGAAES
jgi:hypothetical protein